MRHIGRLFVLGVISSGFLRADFDPHPNGVALENVISRFA